MVHGGPGQGPAANMRRMFDLRRCQIALFDRRGCGCGVPHASDPATDMCHNTTHHLVNDIEQLREQRGIDRWLLHGGSWGATLALVYALAFVRVCSHYYANAGWLPENAVIIPVS